MSATWGNAEYMCLAERPGTAITSDNINGTAVLEYGPTEISAPIQAIWTSTCASLPTAPPTQPRIPARNVRFFTCDCRGLTRLGLSAGGRWIRTSGTARQKPWISAAFRALRGHRRGPKRYHVMVQPFFFCISNHSIEPGWGGVNRLWLAALRSDVFLGRPFDIPFRGRYSVLQSCCTLYRCPSQPGVSRVSGRRLSRIGSTRSGANGLRIQITLRPVACDRTTAAPFRAARPIETASPRRRGARRTEPRSAIQRQCAPGWRRTAPAARQSPAGQSG
jgi:hypothetical protein